MRRRSNERSRCRRAWASYRPVFHMERDRDMSKEEITQTEPQTQPQAEPQIVSTGPGVAMPSQDGGWARAPTWQVARTVAIALLTTAVVLGAFLLLWEVRTFIG